MIIIAAGTVWAVGYAAELIATTETAKLQMIKVEYVGVVAAPIGWLLLGLQLTNQLHRLNVKIIGLLLIIPVATLVQVFTAEFHDLFWRSKELVEYGELRFFRNTYGPGFWIHLFYNYLLNLAGAGLIFATMLQSRLFVRQRVALAVALALPWVANMIYVFKFVGPVDFTPLLIVISGLVLVFGVFQYGLGDIVPVARDHVISEMHDGLMVFDQYERLIDINPAALAILGVDRAPIGADLRELFEGHDKLIQLVQRHGYDTELVYSGINDRVYRISLESIHVGRMGVGSLVLFRDLSLSTRIEDALRLVVESTSADTGEDFFRSLTRSLSMALQVKCGIIAVIDEKDSGVVNTLAIWNLDRFQENFSYALAGTPCENVMERRTSFYAEDVQSLFPEDNILVDLEAESYIGTPLPGYEGVPLGVLVVIDDKPMHDASVGISVLEIFAMRAATEIERRRSELRLRESEAEYRRIVETTRDGVCIVDADGGIQFVNDMMVSIAGDQTREFLVGQNLWNLFEVGEPVRDRFMALEDDTIEVQLSRTNGDVIWVALSKTVITDESGKVNGMLMMFTDVTEERLLQEANKRIESQLQHSQKLESLGVLAGGVAHDFNNLLMPILGYLDLIQQRAGNDHVVASYLNRIKDAGGKLAELCNQMLTYSGQGQFEEKVIDLNVLLDGLNELIRISVSKTLRLEYEQADTQCLLIADEAQLNQVIMNLVINASESMSGGTGTITISTGKESLDEARLRELHNGEMLQPGEYVFIEVADEGVGIEEANVSRLFEPFYTTKFTGRGLGMAVVFGIVRAHQGAIEVDSVLRAGTRVRVYLPCVDEAEVAVSTSGIDEFIQGKGLVLVVDDEEFVRNIVSGMLELLGFKVVLAVDGIDGFEQFRRHKDELVCSVLDLTMPGMNGKELLDKIREEDDKLPVVLVSGYSQGQIREDEVDMGRTAFLQKPFELSGLSAALIKVIDETR